MNPVSKPFLTVTAEQQPCGVQVVEWGGLVDLFRAVFAEEVCGFLIIGPTQRCFSILILRIHIRTIGDEEFDDFLVANMCRKMQRSPSSFSLRIDTHTISQMLFDGFDFTLSGCCVN